MAKTKNQPIFALPDEGISQSIPVEHDEAADHFAPHYRRLAALLPEKGAVLTPSGIMTLVALDLEAKGHIGAGVRTKRDTRSLLPPCDVWGMEDVIKMLAFLRDGCRLNYELKPIALADFLVANDYVAQVRDTSFVLLPKGLEFVFDNKK